jgi:hypothetical protein
MAYLGNNLQVAYSAYLVIDDIAAGFNGSTTSFALTVGGIAPVPFPRNPQNCLISVGGVTQQPDSTGANGFTFSGANIVFSSAPSTGEKFWGVILAGADYVNVGANFPSGTAAVPSVTFDASTGTGLFLAGANVLGIATSGVQQLTVDSSGNVSVTGALSTTSTNTAASFIPTSSTVPTNGVYLPAANSVAISTSSTERLRSDSSGRLLVGTSTARSNLLSDGVVTARIQVEVPGIADTIEFSAIRNANNTNPANLALCKSRGTTVGSNVIVQDGDDLGEVDFCGSDGSKFITAAKITAQVSGAPGTNDMPGRLVFYTTPDGSKLPVERMQIGSGGYAVFKFGLNSAYVGAAQGTTLFQCDDGSIQALVVFACTGTGYNGAASGIHLNRNSVTGRSLNAAGTINASGADYAEYIEKAGDFSIAKGDVCGVTADGLLTDTFADAISFLVKSTNPSYVGGDTWGTAEIIGPKPKADDTEALAQWEEDLEAARQKVDRVAFAGQIPVNVTGATPGQYIVPVAAADGGITGIAKDEPDLTLPEYMRAVGKVIAIEDDGRARIIVKVA